MVEIGTAKQHHLELAKTARAAARLRGKLTEFGLQIYEKRDLTITTVDWDIPRGQENDYHSEIGRGTEVWIRRRKVLSVLQVRNTNRRWQDTTVLKYKAGPWEKRIRRLSKAKTKSTLH